MNGRINDDDDVVIYVEQTSTLANINKVNKVAKVCSIHLYMHTCRGRITHRNECACSKSMQCITHKSKSIELTI
jgi:hypothetical protein